MNKCVNLSRSITTPSSFLFYLKEPLGYNLCSFLLKSLLVFALVGDLECSFFTSVILNLKLGEGDEDFDSSFYDFWYGSLQPGMIMS